MDLTLVKDGIFVMVIGMGTVFIFLTIMIFAMQINAKFLKFMNKFFPEEIPQEKPTKRNSSKSNDEEIALAIACAIAESKAA